VRETLSLTSGGAALHINDLPVTHGQHLISLDSTAAASDEPPRRTDDLVADLRELGLHIDSSLALLPDLKLENLTGLIGAVSGRRAFPPQMPVRDTAPLRIICKQRGKRFRVAAVECFGCRTKLVDHRLSIAAIDSSRERSPGRDHWFRRTRKLDRSAHRPCGRLLSSVGASMEHRRGRSHGTDEGGVGVPWLRGTT